MLLHELSHYKHKDNCANYLLELACVFYWFNPLVWYATKEMRSDQEIACDTALFGLEENIISPENSFLAWNGAVYPFEAWNADQTLSSAMQSSVNWYFQEIDHRLGASALHHYVQEIGYGNKDLGADPASQLTNATDAHSTTASAYWMQSALKISPVEQVMLLSDLHNNRLGFSPENTKTVEDSIRLYSSEAGTLYGKTGTGRVEGKDINGWFIGYVETDGNTYFFATNIHSDTHAAGSKRQKLRWIFCIT